MRSASPNAGSTTADVAGRVRGCQPRGPPDAPASPMAGPRPCVVAPCRVGQLTGLALAVALVAVTLTGCGSGDSTVAKTPQATPRPTATSVAPDSSASPPSGTAAPPPSSVAPANPCAVNLASPTIAKVVSDLPRDPRSQQAWNPEPLAGNYNECAQLSAVIIKANTNARQSNHPGGDVSISASSSRRGCRTPTASTGLTRRSARVTRYLFDPL